MAPCPRPLMLLPLLLLTASLVAGNVYRSQAWRRACRKDYRVYRGETKCCNNKEQPRCCHPKGQKRNKFCWVSSSKGFYANGTIINNGPPADPEVPRRPPSGDYGLNSGSRTQHGKMMCKQGFRVRKDKRFKGTLGFKTDCCTTKKNGGTCCHKKGQLTKLRCVGKATSWKAKCRPGFRVRKHKQFKTDCCNTKKNGETCCHKMGQLSKLSCVGKGPMLPTQLWCRPGFKVKGGNSCCNTKKNGMTCCHKIGQLSKIGCVGKAISWKAKQGVGKATSWKAKQGVGKATSWKAKPSS